MYSNLELDNRIAAEELWVRYAGDGIVVDAYYYDNFSPLMNLKYYLTKVRRQVKRLYGAL